MLPLKLIRSFFYGQNFSRNPLLLTKTHHFFNHDDNLDDTNSTNIITKTRTTKFPLILFTPTQELVTDTYRLAKLARQIGMDLHPNPSLSHIICSWPSSQSSPSSLLFQNDSVPLPFPSFATASLTHLRLFVKLSKGYFKLVFLRNNQSPDAKISSLTSNSKDKLIFLRNEQCPVAKISSLSNNNRECTELSLFSRFTGERIESMDGFSKALLGMGWTLFKTGEFNSGNLSSDYLDRPVYLYRRLDVNGNCSSKKLLDGNGECCRVRELRLPPLDFRNVPLRILQYILLMTDDMFYLA